MALNIAFNTAVSSLLTIAQQLSVASSNITNANTDGYTEKSLKVTTQTTGGVGTSVQAGLISSKVNTYLLKDIARQISTAAAASTASQYYQTLVQDLGTVSSSSTDGTDLSSALSALDTALTSLQTTPDSSSLKAAFVTALDDLTSQLRSTSASIQSLRSEADSEITTTVDDINAQLDTIDTLNDSIVTAKAAGQSTADLEDTRQTALNALAADLNVSYFVDSTGAMRVYAASGKSLIDEGGAVHHLDHVAASSVSASTTYPSGGIQPITLDGEDVTTQISSGKLGALIEQRDSVLTDAQDELDQLAASLSTALNAAANLGSATIPPNTLTGSASVSASDSVTVASGTTVRIALTDSTGAVTSSLDVDLSGDTSVADVMSDLSSLSGVSASIVDGHLVLSAPSGSGVALTTLSGSVGGTDLSGYFGLNDLLSTGTSAATIAVRSDIAANSSLLPAGALDSSTTLAAGTKAVAASSTTALDAMESALTTSTAFAATGTLGGMTTTFANYAAAIISDLSTASKTASTTASTTATTLTTLQSQFSSESGVNTDQESATLVTLQNNYAASAKVVSAVDAMFKTLLAAVES